MLSLLPTYLISQKITRSQPDSSFIKILDDNTMRETIRKTHSAFVLFHADHQRVSDMAYFNYVKVAQKYRHNASFFVVPASVGQDVSRTYAIPSNPCLAHFRFGTKTGIHYGQYSFDSIERFVVNWTQPKIQDITPYLSSKPTEEEIMNLIYALIPDHSLVLVAAVDNTTKFGRSVFSLADELGTFFPFIQLSTESAASAFNVRFPSLALIRFEDSQKSIYTGEPDIDEMFIWAQHNSIPLFRRLNTRNLFSLDGINQRSAIAFLDTSNLTHQDYVFPTLGHHVTGQNWVQMFYTDINDSPALAKFFGVSALPQIVYISANYTHIQYHVAPIDDNITYTAFYEEKLPMKVVPTPVELYDIMRPVSEFSFEKMSHEGPFFALFNSAFCAKCKVLRAAAYDAARTINRNGGNIRWANWDVTKSTPSFQQNISLSIPSVWYFNSTDVYQGQPYVGPQNFLSIIEWVHGKEPSFDLDAIIAKELGDDFDSI